MRTMQRYAAIVVMFLLSYANSLAGDAVQYPFRHLTTDDGLLNNEIVGLRYDSQGILWIETQTGWNTWDGNVVKTVGKGIPTPTEARTSTQNIQRWKKLTLPNKSSVANTVLDIKDDSRGNLWIATDHEGVFIYNKATRQFSNLTNTPSNPTTIAEDHVSVIAIAKNGAVALGHLKKGVSIYQPSPYSLTHFQSATWRNVSCLLEDSRHNLWAGTDGYGLFNLTRRDHYDIPGNIVVTLLEDREGRLWVGTYKEGLLCMQDSGGCRH